MIIRILGEGQLEVPDGRVENLNEHDHALVAAVEDGDEDGFREHLTALLMDVRAAGEPLPDDHLGPSELILPGEDATLEEVRGMLADEGLVPG